MKPRSISARMMVYGEGMVELLTLCRYSCIERSKQKVALAPTVQRRHWNIPFVVRTSPLKEDYALGPEYLCCQNRILQPTTEHFVYFVQVSEISEIAGMAAVKEKKTTIIV